MNVNVDPKYKGCSDISHLPGMRYYYQESCYLTLSHDFKPVCTASSQFSPAKDLLAFGDLWFKTVNLETHCVKLETHYEDASWSDKADRSSVK